MDEVKIDTSVKGDLVSKNSKETSQDTKKAIEREKEKLENVTKKRSISDDLFEINTTGKVKEKTTKSIVKKGDSLDDVTKALFNTVSGTTNKVLTELEKAEYDNVNETVDKSYIPSRLAKKEPINEIKEFKAFINRF